MKDAKYLADDSLWLTSRRNLLSISSHLPFKSNASRAESKSTLTSSSKRQKAVKAQERLLTEKPFNSMFEKETFFSPSKL